MLSDSHFMLIQVAGALLIDLLQDNYYFIICSKIPWIACYVEDSGSKSQSCASAQVSRLTVQTNLNSKIPILTCATCMYMPLFEATGQCKIYWSVS